jgi:hypothetical protein
MMDTVGNAKDGNRYKTEQYCRASRLNAGVKDLGRLMIGMLESRMTTLEGIAAVAQLSEAGIYA